MKWMVMALALVTTAGPATAPAVAYEDETKVEETESSLNEQLAALEEERAETDEAEETATLEAEIELLKARISELEATVLAAPTPASEDGWFRIPGTDIELKPSGYVKVDLIHDFNVIGSTDQFRTAAIPVPDVGGQNTRIHARQTRFDVAMRSRAGSRDFKVYLEGDFFGGPGNAFRLRHAYGEYGGLLGGQTWTTFQDISARPYTLDYEGPDGSIFVRQGLVRFSQPFGDGSKWSFSLEEPRSNVRTAIAGQGMTRYPDLTTAFRHEMSRGHLYVSGLLRNIGFEARDGSLKDSTVGGGVNFMGAFDTVGADKLYFQAAFGNGIGRYVEDLTTDAIVNTANQVETIPVAGFYLGYMHPWSDVLSSTVLYSAAEANNRVDQSDDAIKRTQYLAANLLWNAVPRLQLGVEYLYGQRENKDGQKGHANRFQFSVRYNIN